MRTHFCLSVSGPAAKNPDCLKCSRVIIRTTVCSKTLHRPEVGIYKSKRKQALYKESDQEKEKVEFLFIFNP